MGKNRNVTEKVVLVVKHKFDTIDVSVEVRTVVASRYFPSAPPWVPERRSPLHTAIVTRQVEAIVPSGSNHYLEILIAIVRADPHGFSDMIGDVGELGVFIEVVAEAVDRLVVGLVANCVSAVLYPFAASGTPDPFGFVKFFRCWRAGWWRRTGGDGRAGCG